MSLDFGVRGEGVIQWLENDGAGVGCICSNGILGGSNRQ